MIAPTPTPASPLLPPLPSLPAQAAKLIDLGLHRLAGVSATTLRASAAAVEGSGLLVVHPDVLPPSALAPHVEIDGRRAFVVTDMTDVDRFAPVPVLPDSPAYVVVDPRRGDEMSNWSPDEADPAIIASGRTPLLLTEGLHWLLHRPDVLQRGRCFMTTGSRLRREDGALDARTPALWFSNGTGRDGADRRHAPKVGWCWAGNRHTWLGMATAAGRLATPSPAAP